MATLRNSSTSTTGVLTVGIKGVQPGIMNLGVPINLHLKSWQQLAHILKVRFRIINDCWQKANLDIFSQWYIEGS
jgi:hypothetical protein